MEPRDPRSSGWAVVGVAFEQPDLCRYHVARFDGVPGIMDVAAPGTQAAAALHAFAAAQPPGAVLDQGVDLLGRTFVIAHPMAFAPVPPPPPPGVAPGAGSGGTKWVLLGIGALVAIGVVVILVRGSDAPPKPRLYLHAYGMWKPDCHPTYELTVSTREDAEITVLDHRTFADYSGSATIELTEAEIGERDELEVKVDHRKGAGSQIVTIDGRPDPALPLGVTEYFGDSGWREGTFTIGVDSHPLDIRTGYANDSTLPAHARFEIAGCGLAPSTSAANGIQVSATAEHVTVMVDIGERMLRIPGDAPPELLEIPVSLSTADGKPVALTLTLDALPSYTDNPAAARIADVANNPIADAPAVGNVATPRPVMIVWNGGLDRALLEGAAPLDAPYVAIVTTATKDAGSCGPYSEYYGGYAQYADRLRYDADVKLYEARTSTLVAKTYIKGKKPSCPDMVSTYGGVVSSVDGDVPSAAVNAWLKKHRE